MQPQRNDLRQAIAQAVALQRAGRSAEAENLCRGILRIQPDEPTALQVLGECLLRRGDFAQAEQLLAACLGARPDQHLALMNHGIALHALGRHAEALARYTSALALKPNDGVLIWYLARALTALGRDREALAAFAQATTLLGAHADLLLEQQRVADRLLKTSPGDRQALVSRANVHAARRQWQLAYDAFASMLARFPDDPTAMTGLAGVCLWLDRPEEAVTRCEAVLQRRPNDVRALGHQATAFAQLGNYEQAVQVLDAALALDGDNAALHWNRALYRLVQGQFANAWADFEWRWERSPHLQWLRTLPEALWDGRTDISGKTILIHSEQGFGDAIQCARYVPLLAEKGARVIIGAHPPLKSLLATIESVGAVIVNGEEMPEVDLHCPIMSLPARFGTTLDSIPSKVPYVRADPTRVQRWCRLLGPKQKMRIGLAWSGSPSHEEDARRSIRLQLLEPLFSLPAEFFCLGKDVRDEERIDMRRLGVRYWGDELHDFAETAALTMQTDLVIAVDTSVAHLAGALAKPLWLLIASPPDWRWMTARSDSPWYPTARLFRQRSRGDWAEVIERVRDDLVLLIDARASEQQDAGQ